MYNPINRITHAPNGCELKAPWYEGVEVSDNESQLAWLREQWSKHITPADPNSSECVRCRGRGYTRKDGRVGCLECFGTGRVSP